MDIASAALNVEPTPPTPPVELRSAPRFAAALVPSITGLRLSPHGIDAKLVNISATGLLAECGMRLKVGSAVALSFEGTFTPASTAARVVRCAVASMSSNGGLLYHVGVHFDARIPLEDPSGTAKTKTIPEATPPESAPVHVVVRNRW
jgi:hypothetical protein